MDNNNNFMRKIVGRSVLLLSLTFGFVANTHATSISIGQIFWDTFTITANGSNITDSINWTLQEDFIDSSYREGSATSFTKADHSITPNPGWATSQTTVDGGVATTLAATVSSDLLSSNVQAAYTSQTDGFVSRFGRFDAPVSGTYTFSVDFLASAEINALNTELLGGPTSSQPSAAPFIELQYNNTSDLGNFVFEFHEDTDLNNVFSSTGEIRDTLSITTRFDGTSPIVFSAGDTIEILATIDNFARSFSSETIPINPPDPNPVPAPAAIWLILAGLLFSQYLRRIN